MGAAVSFSRKAWEGTGELSGAAYINAASPAREVGEEVGATLS